MPSFEHKQLIETIAALDLIPKDPEQFSEWIEAGRHLKFLRGNANADEIVVLGSGDYTFVHSVVVPDERLSPVDVEDLLKWSCNAYTSVASYVYGGGREDMWIERGLHLTGAKTLDGAFQLVFGRSFEGWIGPDRSYFELHQEYAHIADIHWRPEQRAYCRFDADGDIDHVVSVTNRQEEQTDVSLVSFKWEPLEEYLAVSKSSLVQMFGFTLLRRENFSHWPEGPEQVIHESDEFFYRQKILPGHAAYTRGVQIIRPRRPTRAIFTDIKDGRAGRRDKRYVEFIAEDWRNHRITKISTDPSASTNYFQASRNTLPFELSPAFFRPEVLLKYKADRDKYTVGERDIRCRAAWSLKGFDVNKAGQVHAYICDLRNIPYAEQLHWLSFNEAPKAPISERAVVNDFKGEFFLFTAPLMKVLNVVKRWNETRVPWWSLRDERLLERVNIPLSSSRDEWSDAFMELSKLVVEGLDVKFIRAQLDSKGIAYDPRDQSIALLQNLLNHESAPEEQKQLHGLRTVQRIRTKAKGHSGSSEAEQLARDAIAQHESFAAHFDHICDQVADELGEIGDLFV